MQTGKGATLARLAQKMPMSYKKKNVLFRESCVEEMLRLCRPALTLLLLAAGCAAQVMLALPPLVSACECPLLCRRAGTW